MKIKFLRWFVLAAIFTGITIGLVLNTNLGTLSSFGWQTIATICPLGVLESALAAKTIFPPALIALLAVAALVLLLGKAFCSWVCPVAPISSFFNIIQKKIKQCALPAASEKSDAGKTPETADKTPTKNLALDANSISRHSCNSNCEGCSAQRAKLDSRHLVLGGSLLSALVFGFPVFCLICPIGLLFGTVIVIWQLIGFDDFGLSLLIYPLMLAVELLVLRKWCARFCPLGAFFSLLSLPNRMFKPVVNQKKCIRSAGGTCRICTEICQENLDPHYSSSLNECSKCGLCKDNCPTGAISFALMPKSTAYQKIEEVKEAEEADGGR